MINIKLLVCKGCLLDSTCDHNYDRECKKLAEHIFITALSGTNIEEIFLNKRGNTIGNIC